MTDLVRHKECVMQVERFQYLSVIQREIRVMANIAQQRIQREFREVVKSKEIAESGVQLELVNDDLMELAGQVAGPPDTPYAGGKYKLEIKIPDTYPFSPPKVSH